MPRRIRASNLETRSSRFGLPIAKKPIFVRVNPGVGLGYRRNRTAGTWVVRVADGKGGNWTDAIGIADDYDEANGETVLDYWQAQDKAKIRAATEQGHAITKPATLREALDTYEADLKTRGGDIGNVARVRGHLSDRLLNKQVGALTWGELRKWRDGLAATLVPATVNRICAGLKAALNLSAADPDQRIGSRQAWETGLATILDAEESRNVVLKEEVVRQVIAEAYNYSPEFGLLVDVAAVTGARVSQMARLKVQDLQANRADPRLMMPSSRKGRGKKKVAQRPVPIPAGLARRLGDAVKDQPGAAPLLTKPTTGRWSGGPWNKSDHARPFNEIVERCGLADRQQLGYPAEVTLYALRHTSIVRAILANVPLRVIAANHDTSVVMIERNYSAFITDHSDAITRAALLDTVESDDDNVLPMPQRAAS
jgi:integrase